MPSERQSWVKNHQQKWPHIMPRYGWNRPGWCEDRPETSGQSEGCVHQSVASNLEIMRWSPSCSASFLTERWCQKNIAETGTFETPPTQQLQELCLMCHLLNASKQVWDGQKSLATISPDRKSLKTPNPSSPTRIWCSASARWSPGQGVAFTELKYPLKLQSQHSVRLPHWVASDLSIANHHPMLWCLGKNPWMTPGKPEGRHQIVISISPTRSIYKWTKPTDTGKLTTCTTFKIWWNSSLEPPLVPSMSVAKSAGMFLNFHS